MARKKQSQRRADLTPEQRESRNASKRELRTVLARKYHLKENGKNANGVPEMYRHEFCLRVIEWMKQGYTLESFAGEIGVCIQTIYKWRSEYPDFDSACKQGFAASLRWREKFLFGVATGQIKGGNMTGAIFAVKCHQSRTWREADTTVQPNVYDAMTDEQLMAELEKMRKKPSGAGGE